MRPGQWRLRRHDPSNSARADLAAAVTSAPIERWRSETGGDIRSVAPMMHDDTHIVVALAGSVLQVFDDDGGVLWSLPHVRITRIIAVGDLDGTGRGAILARRGDRTLLLLDASRGGERWRWTAETGTFIHDTAGVLVVPLTDGSRIILCPTYASEVLAFDLSGDGPPRRRWTIAGPWDAGFGPSAIAVDMDGDGRRELVLSSRIGSADRTRSGRTTTSERVLGRRHGQLYQAVHDLEDGSLRDEVAYAPFARIARCARPYGLLTAAPFRPGERAGVVMVSCQVEEYLAVTRRTADGGLRRAWGHFVEKDWPVDERELRVHPDSFGDIDDDGRPELVVSLWQDGRWRTVVLDPSVGWDAPRAVLDDRVCWGTLRAADGTTTLVLSAERTRATGAATRLELRSGRGLGVLATLDDASVLGAADGPLPPEVAFMARRTAGTKLPWPGGEAMVVRRWSGPVVRSVAAWAVDDGAARVTVLARTDAARVDPGPGPGGVLLSGADGRIRRVALTWSTPDGAKWSGQADPRRASGAVVRRIRPDLVTHGREPGPLVRSTTAGPELIVDHAGDRIVGGRRSGRRALRDRWTVEGRLPAIPTHADRKGGGVGSEGGVAGGERPGADGDAMRSLVFAGRRVAGAPDRVIASMGPGQGHPDIAWELGAPLDHPPLALPGDRYALTLRTGVHTLATVITDKTGAVTARVQHGAYLNPPALLKDVDETLLILDDHGILLALDLDGGERWRRDWTAAYSRPITGPFLKRGRPAILRANGIHGLELLDAAGRRRWRRESPLWRYAAGAAAIMTSAGGGLVAAQPRRDGILELFAVANGEVRWELDLGPEAEGISVSSGDVDGDGSDELLVGVSDGRLMCVADSGARPDVRWVSQLDAGVTDAFLADTDGDGVAEIVAVTSDGVVRILDQPSSITSRRISASRRSSVDSDSFSGSAGGRSSPAGLPSSRAMSLTTVISMCGRE